MKDIMKKTKQGFTPLKVFEGYRKDGTFFGICSECGESIVYSYVHIVSPEKDADGRFIIPKRWQHTKREKSEIHGGITSTELDYCPVVVAKEFIIEAVKVDSV